MSFNLFLIVIVIVHRLNYAGFNRILEEILHVPGQKVLCILNQVVISLCAKFDPNLIINYNGFWMDLLTDKCLHSLIPY